MNPQRVVGPLALHYLYGHVDGIHHIDGKLLWHYITLPVNVFLLNVVSYFVGIIWKIEYVKSPILS